MSEWLERVLDSKVTLTCSKDGRLSSSAFLHDGRAEAMATKLRAAVHPFIRSVEVKNGWILLELSPVFYEHLIKACRPTPEPNLLDRAENRLNIWRRHGDGGCPDDPVVKRVLLRCAFGLATDWDILTMTHHLDSIERVRLESGLKGVAESILFLRRMNS